MANIILEILPLRTYSANPKSSSIPLKHSRSLLPEFRPHRFRFRLNFLYEWSCVALAFISVFRLFLWNSRHTPKRRSFWSGIIVFFLQESPGTHHKWFYSCERWFAELMNIFSQVFCHFAGDYSLWMFVLNGHLIGHLKRTLASEITLRHYSRTLPLGFTLGHNPWTLPSNFTLGHFPRTLLSYITLGQYPRTLPSIITVGHYPRTLPSNDWFLK